MLHRINDIDGDILLFIQQYMRNPVLTPIIQMITRLGDHALIWILISGALLCFRKTRKVAVAALLALLICFIINNQILKNVLARPRPFDQMEQIQVLIAKPTDYSFPSGHTASSFAAAGTFYYYGNRKWGVAALVLAGLIGFSRLYLGVHYPSDVIAGVIVGSLVSYHTSRCFTSIKLRNKKKVIVE